MDIIADTQTQPTTTQSQSIWMTMESQPVEKIVWGRLYSKNQHVLSLDLCNDSFTAGRLDDCTLQFCNREFGEKFVSRISKVHFKIERDLSDLTSPVYIHDMGRNGTFVNGDKIGYTKKRILVNNDVISVVNQHYKLYMFQDLGSNKALKLDEDINKIYYISKELGSGACGVVRLIYEKLTCMEFAMKHVVKNKLSDSSRVRSANEEERVMNEVRIMKSLDHPCVIRMHDIIDKPDAVYMVLEYMKGGDLLTRIIKNKRLTEKISKFYFYQMCLAVKYLHDKGITHRDLKPDNVLLATDDDETILKVSDFGLSKFVAKDSVMRTLCGTPLYVAPEILVTRGRGAYTKKVDIWSLGVVLFTCLSGSLPFSDDYGTHASEQIKRGVFEFRSPAWKTVTPVAKSLILELLTVPERRRPNIDQILNHPWLRDRQMVRKVTSLMKIGSTNHSANIGQLQQAQPQPPPARPSEFLEPPTKRVRVK